MTTPGATHDFSGPRSSEYFADADAFIAGIRERYPRELMQAAPRLTVGCSTIIGTEHIDVDAATELGIVIGFGATPENYLGVAEAVVMLAAALIKRLPQKWAAMREGGYRVSQAGHMVRHGTIGMIGLGNVGRLSLGASAAGSAASSPPTPTSRRTSRPSWAWSWWIWKRSWATPTWSRSRWS